MVDLISIILLTLFFSVLLIYMLYECYIRENRVINIFGRMKLYNNILNSKMESSEDKTSINYEEV
jgi:hypothetical protein